MRKELEFPQIDESKLEMVTKIINHIVDKGSGDCSKELAELSKITGKEHNEMEFAEYWGWTDLDNLAMTAMIPEPPCIKGLERSEIIILITMIKDSFESGEDNKAGYYIELLHKSLPLSNVIDYIMSRDSIEEIYEVFIENIKEYYDLYERGLKKEANKQINKFISEFQTILPKETQREFLYKLCYDVCDSGDMHKLKQRGNGRLPYSLDKLIWEYLREQCKLETIPQLRWTYELYSYNPFDRKFNSFEMLKKAFCHKDCDQKTIDLYFEHLLSILDWGAHHFPQGCIIERSTYEKTLCECHEILAHRSISSCQINELMYFEKLYKCFYEYGESGNTKDFYKLCQDDGIDFESAPAFYYRK